MSASATINTNDMQVATKLQLLTRIANGIVDAPRRHDSSLAGWKRPSARSELIKSLKACRNEQELTAALRGRTPTHEEHEVAIRMASMIQVQSIQPNLAVVFNFDWHDLMAPENANVASYCILEWVWRLAKNVQLRRECKAEVILFVAVPEIWDREMKHVPLHYHMALKLDDYRRIDQIGAIGRRLWYQLLKQRGLGGPNAYVYIEACTNTNSLSRYGVKQSDIDWVFQRTLTTSDLVRYRS